MKHTGHESLFVLLLALALSCLAQQVAAQQVSLAHHQRSQNDMAAQAAGLRTLINALFPEAAAWPDPAAWPRLNPRQAVDLAAALTRVSADETSLYASMGALDARIFSVAWNTCQPESGCLKQSRDAWGGEHIFYAGYAPNAEGYWSALWSKPSQGSWRRFVFPWMIERVNRTPNPDVVVYQPDFHDGATYLAMLKSDPGGALSDYAALVFVPLDLDLRTLEVVHEPDIVRPAPPCLTEKPAFADAAASNCEPLESLATYLGLPWMDPVAPALNPGRFRNRVEILGRARDPALADWRLVRLSLLHIDARDATRRRIPHHITRGTATSPATPLTEPHLDYAVGWINLRSDPASRSDWSFRGRP
jgi:hypothetical protein